VCIPSSHFINNPNATYEQSSKSSRGRGGNRVGVFPQALIADLVAIARGAGRGVESATAEAITISGVNEIKLCRLKR
jgi:hypothetical protein